MTLKTKPFSEQVALVTGGGTGIGRAFAGALAATGARVVIASRSEEVLRRTAVENDVFEHLKRLAGLRNGLPAVRHGSLVQLYDEEQQTAYARVLRGAKTVIVVINNDTKPTALKFNVSALHLPDGTPLDDALGVVKGRTKVEGGTVSVTLPARSACMLLWVEGYMPEGFIPNGR